MGIRDAAMWLLFPVLVLSDRTDALCVSDISGSILELALPAILLVHDRQRIQDRINKRLYTPTY